MDYLIITSRINAKTFNIISEYIDNLLKLWNELHLALNEVVSILTRMNVDVISPDDFDDFESMCWYLENKQFFTIKTDDFKWYYSNIAELKKY